MPTDANLQLATRYLRHLEANDVDAAFALVHAEATFWVPGPGTMDKVAMKAFLGPVTQLVERMAFTLEGATVQGDRVALEVSGAAQLKNGRAYRNRYHFLFEVRHGLLITVREYCDTAPAQVFIA
jgi:ketosteroid isomerase-like protein